MASPQDSIIIAENSGFARCYFKNFIYFPQKGHKFPKKEKN